MTLPSVRAKPPHSRRVAAAAFALGCSAGGTLFYRRRRAAAPPSPDGGGDVVPARPRHSPGADDGGGVGRRRRPLSELLRLSTLESLVEAGDLYTDQSACDVSRWRMSDRAVFWAKLGWGLCSSSDPGAVLTSDRIWDVRPLDTVFVDSTGLSRFAKEILPRLTVDVVVLTEHGREWDPAEYGRVVEHPRVVHVFTQNPWMAHTKMSGIPQGVGRVMEGPKNVEAYREQFRGLNRDPSLKTGGVFASHLSVTANTPGRRAVPSGPRLEYPDYAAELARHSYVISPDGDRPDCKRNWEAIGLGAVPITQLDPDLYSFMAPAGVVFDHRGSWEVRDLEAVVVRGLTDNGLPVPRGTDRRCVFEVYWMDRMEHIVGRELNWRKSLV